MSIERTRIIGFKKESWMAVRSTLWVRAGRELWMKYGREVF